MQLFNISKFEKAFFSFKVKKIKLKLKSNLKLDKII